jgi:chaperone required for assembly of F1-ATPase
MTGPSPSDRPKRFYEAAKAERAGDAWTVALDGRLLKTPARAAFLLPTRRLAETIAAEWQAQGKQIDLASMPLTRLANVAIDRTPETRDDMADEVARYCETDLVCHLAHDPIELSDLQEHHWAPVREWAGDTFGIHLIAVTGIIASPQPEASLEAAREAALGLDDFRLTALVYACGLYGSALLALAVIEDALDPLVAFEYSRIDEDWQMRQWGEDDEAKENAARRRAEAKALKAWLEGLHG